MLFHVRVRMFILLAVVLAPMSIPQVTTNSGSGLAASYTSLANAITALNAATITSPVVITLSGNETAPAGGYVITASGTAVNTITIQGSSSTITAYSPQTSGGTADAILKLVGSDYVTLQNFTLQENAANTTTTLASNTMTEFGVALFLAAATNGAQNNTIKNNTISLGGTYQNAIGIFSTSANSYTAGTLAATATSGTNANNKFYGNTISSVAYGMYFICEPVTATITESGNDIGGSSFATGNTITFGLATASDNTLNRYTGAVSGGIVFRNGIGNSVKYNTITSNTASYAHTSGVGGIVVSSGTAPTGVAVTTSISYNRITVNQTGTTAISGIDFGHGLSTCHIDGSFNKIVLTHNVSAANSALMYGIKAGYASATNTIREDTITISQSTVTGASNSIVRPVDAKGAGTTVTVSRNILTFSQTTTSGTFGGTVYGIDCSAASGTIYADSNFIGSGAASIRHQFFGILPDAVTGAIYIRGNTITVDRAGGLGGTFGIFNNADTTPYSVYSNNTITFSNISSNQGVFGIISAGGNTTYTGNKSMNNNTITVSGTGTGATTGISYYRGNTATVNDNTVTIAMGCASITGIQITSNTTATSVLRNTVSLATTSATASALYGISSAGTGAMVFGDNTISQITGTGVITAATTTMGITITAGTGVRLYGNTIKNISMGASGTTGGQTIHGIYVGAVTSPSINRNKIYALSTVSSNAASSVAGITLNAPITADTVYNNLIGGLSAPQVSGTDVLRGINVTASGASLTHFLYYNTIYLNATSTSTNFGSSGIYHTANATATTSALRMLNNCIVNAATPNGTGASVAFRRSAGTAGMLANYDAASNNNLFFAGTPSAANLIYSDGTTDAQTLSGYKSGVYTAGTIAPRDSNSVTGMPTFISTTGADATYLHISLASSYVAAAGKVIAGFTTDYDGQTRDTTAPDIGADEFSFAGTLSVSLIPQAMYDVGTNSLSASPLVKVYFANSTSPYAYVDSASITIDSLTFTGSGTYNYAPSGTYYLVVKGNGILETWSRAGGEAYTAGGTLTYNFTTTANKAYADNQIQIAGKYCMYSGDVNDDGLIDLNDMILIDNDNANFTGGFGPTDLNMDGIVDLNDMIIADNNAGLFVGVQRPSAVVRGVPVKQRSE